MSAEPLQVLVTGFEPFNGSSTNPSQLVASSVDGALGEGARVAELKTALLPVDSGAIAGQIEALWAAHDPDVVLHFGESAKADRITLERVAVNLLDFDCPDNAGRVERDRPIDASGPAARFVTLGVRELSERLAGQGVESVLSLSAGAYLCNQALYLSLGEGESRGGRSVGFVHVPSLEEQVERGERAGPGVDPAVLIEQAGRLVRASVDLHRGRAGGGGR